MRKAISVTLSEDNLLWLKGQATRSASRSVSALLDQLVGQARRAGWADAAAVRSVAGTIDLPGSDPDLAEADAYVRALFAESAARPLVVRDRKARARSGRRG